MSSQYNSLSVWITLSCCFIQVDNVKNPSWQAQVSGSKLWTLEPPPECYMECVNKIETIVRPGEISMYYLFFLLVPYHSMNAVILA